MYKTVPKILKGMKEESNGDYKGKIAFRDTKGKRHKSFTGQDILDFQLMNGKGIYIYYSPGINKAYVGKSNNILERLKVHIFDAFNSVPSTNSCTVLRESDAEMYCCFLEDTYNYDVDNPTKELNILEGITMDAVINTGINLVNRNPSYYKLENLSNNSFDKFRNSIELTHDLFRFGLKDFLLHKDNYYSSKRYEKENRHLRMENTELNEHLKDMEKQLNSLKEEKQKMYNKFKILNKKYEKISRLIEEIKNINIDE